MSDFNRSAPSPETDRGQPFLRTMQSVIFFVQMGIGSRAAASIYRVSESHPIQSSTFVSWLLPFTEQMTLMSCITPPYSPITPQ
jgi:hypothetical protein